MQKAVEAGEETAHGVGRLDHGNYGEVRGVAETEKVIKELARIREDHFGGMTSYEGEVLSAALELLKAQDPKIGHWVDKCCRDFHCSECNHKLIDNRWIHADGYCYDDLPKYCPECGVKMGRGIIQMRFAGEDKIVYPDYEKRAK